MGANANRNPHIRLDRTRFVLAGFRLQIDLGFRVGNGTVKLGQCAQHLLGAVQNPYRLDGSMLERKGTMAVIAPIPPTAAVATIKRRLSPSILLSVLIVLTLRTKLQLGKRSAN